MRNGPGTDTNNNTKVVYGNAIILAYFVILRRFQCSRTYQAIGDPVDTGRKLNVHKTFRRRPERLMYVQFMFCIYRDERAFLLKKLTP